MSPAYVTQRTKRVDHYNRHSGHRWTTLILLKGFEVNGGRFCTSTHMTEKAANEEADFRNEFNRKYPFIMPRSKNEIARCKKLGLPISMPYKEMETGKIIY